MGPGEQGLSPQSGSGKPEMAERPMPTPGLSLGMVLDDG